MIDLFQQEIIVKKLFNRNDKLLLAVSGGVDSVVLCELCKQSGFNFIIAHCNFQLRGEESERDEKFVKELGKKYSTEVLVKRMDTEKYVTEKKVSIQVAARDLRYDWFNQLIKEDKRADYILTAHHADDNAETLLMNFCRGTGLHGLTGIPAKTDRLVRPLLDFSKQQLLDFANENKLSFVEDSSNQSSKYTRNLFRNEIIPLIEKVFPQLKENLQDNIRRFTAIEQLYQFSTDELKKKLFRKKGNEIHIPVKQLLGFKSNALIYSIISDYGFNEKQVDEVLKLAASDSGKYIQSPSGKFRMIRHRHWFIISPQQDITAENIIIEEKDSHISFANGHLALGTIKPSVVQKDQAVALLDNKDIQFPLLLRKWKQGDYFYPLGMTKKKKVSRFLIDQKLSKSSKEQVWVVEMNKKILWVVGMRIDDRYKVTEKTKQVLQMVVHVSE